MTENTEFQDQGSLDQPEQSTQQPGEAVRSAESTEPGPTDPVLDEHLENPDGPAQSLQGQEVPETDDSSASTLQRVNEAREAGEPLDGSLGGGGDQPAVTPAGTGASAAPTAGTAGNA